MLLTKCLCMGKLSVGGRQDDGRLSKLFLICFGQAVGWARRATFMKETRRKRPCSGLWSNSVWLTFVILHLDRETTWARDVTKLTAWLMVMCLKGLELIGAGCFLPSRNEILPGTAVIFVLNVAVSWLCTVDVCLSVISLHYCLTVSAVMLGGCVALVWMCVYSVSVKRIMVRAGLETQWIILGHFLSPFCYHLQTEAEGQMIFPLASLRCESKVH